MDVYPTLSFYINMDNSATVDIQLPKALIVGKAANVPVTIFHIKDEHCPYEFGTNANNNASSINAVFYKPAASCFENMAEYEVV